MPSIHNEELEIAAQSNGAAQIFCVDDGEVVGVIELEHKGASTLAQVASERTRRLVACWNALAGMSTEDIEALAAKNKSQRLALEADERAAADGCL